MELIVVGSFQDEWGIRTWHQLVFVLTKSSDLNDFTKGDLAKTKLTK